MTTSSLSWWVEAAAKVSLRSCHTRARSFQRYRVWWIGRTQHRTSHSTTGGKTQTLPSSLLPVPPAGLAFPAGRSLCSSFQRYTYTIGWTDVKFEILTTLKSTKGTLERLRKDGGREGHGLIGINDDMEGSEVPATRGIFKGWMEETWPGEQFALPFERS